MQHDLKQLKTSSSLDWVDKTLSELEEQEESHGHLTAVDSRVLANARRFNEKNKTMRERLIDLKFNLHKLQYLKYLQHTAAEQMDRRIKALQYAQNHFKGIVLFFCYMISV